jgi:hypothetical protein
MKDLIRRATVSKIRVFSDGVIVSPVAFFGEVAERVESWINDLSREEGWEATQKWLLTLPNACDHRNMTIVEYRQACIESAQKEKEKFRKDEKPTPPEVLNALEKLC